MRRIELTHIRETGQIGEPPLGQAYSCFWSYAICYHSCQNVNHIVNRFFIIFCIVYRKIYKHFIKFIKNYRYTYINGIFIINFEYIQLIINLIITYAIIFNKTN